MAVHRSADAFLPSRKPRPWQPLQAPPAGITPVAFYLHDHGLQIEVAYASAAGKPTVVDLRKLWNDRWGRRPAALLLVVGYDSPEGRRASLVGLRGEAEVGNQDLEVAARAVAKALAEPNVSDAEAILAALLAEQDPDAVPGLRNAGLFATHELLHNVPERIDWPAAGHSVAGVLGCSGADVLSALGWSLSREGNDYLLGSDGQHRAVAVVLEGKEVFDRSSSVYGGSTPVEHALAVAHRHNVRWVLAVKGTLVRLYTADPDTGLARKGTATYTEIDLALLPADRLGYAGLLLTPSALSSNGSVTEILAASADHAADLGARLRKRVYEDVVPDLATAVARQLRASSESGLDRAYHVTLVILFRLLFVAYAEDRGLLPYATNEAYRAKALKTRARHYAKAIADSGKTVFEPKANDIWHDLQAIWRGIHDGHHEWSIPAYGGGLFDPKSDTGTAIAGMTLRNTEIGPALERMLVDTGPDGTQGPIDFQSLSVREFGTIYEGLLESSLSLAPTDLTLDSKNAYVPAAKGDEVVAPAGSVYFHNSSGVRKSTGSYFTKEFAVEHLLRTALDPSIEEHLTRVTTLLGEQREAEAATALFDFRVADLAMGSGHFLVAAIDHIGNRFAAFLDEHPIGHVTAELDGLRTTAVAMLEDAGIHQIPTIDQMGLVRRQVARRCIYGVDLNQIAVDLARLAVWIHTFIPGLPMSTLDHGLVVGNSLTGIGTLDEAIEVLSPDEKNGQISVVRTAIEDGMAAGAAPLRRLALLAESTVTESREAAGLIDEARTAVEPTRFALDAAVAGRLGLLNLRELSALGWDSVVPGAKRPDVQQKVQEIAALHFPVAFPEVFSRRRAGFDVILGNPPWEEATIEENKFWGFFDTTIRAADSASQAAKVDAWRRKRPDLYAVFRRTQAKLVPLRQVLLSGPFPGMGTGDPDLYKAFSWRFWSLLRESGHFGVVLPRSVFGTLGSGDWRKEVIPRSYTQIHFAVNEQEWLFTDVNPGWPISLVSVHKCASEVGLTVAGPSHTQQQFTEHSRTPIGLPISMLLESDPTLCVPTVDSPDGLVLFRLLIDIPPIGRTRPDIEVRPAAELHATNDGKKRYFTNDSADHPVYNHTNIGHFVFNPEVGAFNYVSWQVVRNELQARRLRTYRRADSPFRSRDATWAHDPATLPAANPRIAFRDVVHASNPRKVWAALLPRNTVLTNKAPYLVFTSEDLEAQAYVLGILGSSTCDWFGHLRISLNLNFFIFNSLPVPVYDPSDARCRRVSQLAGKLAVRPQYDYGKWSKFGPYIENLEERSGVIAELDAICSILYGVPTNLMPLIFDGRESRPSLAAVQAWRERWATES